MNTPPRTRRYDPRVKGGPPPGSYVGCLNSPSIARELGFMASLFVQLEANMIPWILSKLSGADFHSSGYILRAIRSPRGRYDVMSDLLELSPNNVEMPGDWDEVLSEFWSINKRRNAYVHGLWWTNQKNLRTWLCEADDDEHGLGFLNARPASATELSDVSKRIGELTKRIVRLTAAPLPVEPPLPPDAPTHRRGHRNSVGEPPTRRPKSPRR